MRQVEKYPNLYALSSQMQKLRVKLAPCIMHLEGEGADQASFMCAKYPANSTGYVRHRDAKPERGGRKLTCLCYFNNDWVSEHGGKLRIWPSSPANHDDIDEDTCNNDTTAFIDDERKLVDDWWSSGHLCGTKYSQRKRYHGMHLRLG